MLKCKEKENELSVWKKNNDRRQHTLTLLLSMLEDVIINLAAQKVLLHIFLDKIPDPGGWRCVQCHDYNLGT